MVIIGGGVIGVEMASVFSRIGTQVTILEYADHLIAMMDHDLGKNLQKILKKKELTSA
jgi:dihydrolipoamide dehydrogenase